MTERSAKHHAMRATEEEDKREAMKVARWQARKVEQTCHPGFYPRGVARAVHAGGKPRAPGAPASLGPDHRMTDAGSATIR